MLSASAVRREGVSVAESDNVCIEEYVHGDSLALHVGSNAGFLEISTSAQSPQNCPKSRNSLAGPHAVGLAKSLYAH